MHCFECGSVGQIRLLCPHREEVRNEAGQSNDENSRVTKQ